MSNFAQGDSRVLSLKGWVKEFLMGKHSIRKNAINVYTRWVHLCSLLVAFAFILVSVMGFRTAFANDKYPSYTIKAGSYNGLTVSEENASIIGVIDEVDYKPIYCIEIGSPYKLYDGKWVTVPSYTRYATTIAKLIQYYRNDMSVETQGSIAYEIHNRFDVNPDLWDKYKGLGFVEISNSDLMKQANNLWEYAEQKVAEDIRIENHYTNGKRAGVLKVAVLNNRYGTRYVDGAHFKIESTNKLVHFDYGNTQTFEGTSKDDEISLPWTADGDGKANFKVYIEEPYLERWESSGQDVIRYGGYNWVEKKSVEFDVQKHLIVKLSSEMLTKELHVGDLVVNNVSLSTLGFDDWIEGMNVLAKGYYFVGDSKNILKQFKPEKDETASNYVNRLRGTGSLRQVAAAEANFTNARQKIAVVAKKATGDLTSKELDEAPRYKVDENDAGMFGSWVWVISLSDQKDPAKSDEENKNKLDWFTGDYIDGLGGSVYSAVHQGKAKIFHDSVVKQNVVGLGEDIVGTVSVGGLPKDYGDFSGNEEYGFNSDAKSHIRVWWAGDGGDNLVRGANDKYRPGAEGESKKAEPKEDSHHHLIADWEVPAKNGVYTIGGGKIRFRSAEELDKNKPGEVIKDIINIQANKISNSGWYVFVYSFPGSSRARAFTSDYDDVWNRTLVEPVSQEELNPASITTDVSSSMIVAGEKFHDTAHIVGNVPRGSYVLFNAYSHANVVDPTVQKGSENTNSSGSNPNGSSKDNKVVNTVSLDSNSESKSDTVKQLMIDKGERIVKQNRVNITDEQADNSSKTQIDVDSVSVSVSHGATVYWKAELYDSRGKPLASHALGVENETVHVVSDQIGSKLDNKTHSVGEPIRDTVFISEPLPEGSYVEFTAWDAVDGAHSDSDTAILDHRRVNIPKEAVEHIKKGGSITVVSPQARASREGLVYWKAELFDSSGKPIVRGKNNGEPHVKKPENNDPSKEKEHESGNVTIVNNPDSGSVTVVNNPSGKENNPSKPGSTSGSGSVSGSTNTGGSSSGVTTGGTDVVSGSTTGTGNSTGGTTGGTTGSATGGTTGSTGNTSSGSTVNGGNVGVKPGSSGVTTNNPSSGSTNPSGGSVSTGDNKNNGSENGGSKGQDKKNPQANTTDPNKTTGSTDVHDSKGDKKSGEGNKGEGSSENTDTGSTSENNGGSTTTVNVIGSDKDKGKTVTVKDIANIVDHNNNVDKKENKISDTDSSLDVFSRNIHLLNSILQNSSFGEASEKSKLVKNLDKTKQISFKSNDKNAYSDDSSYENELDKSNSSLAHTGSSLSVVVIMMSTVLMLSLVLLLSKFNADEKRRNMRRILRLRHYKMC